jgi:hypothetical protein
VPTSPVLQSLRGDATSDGEGAERGGEGRDIVGVCVGRGSVGAEQVGAGGPHPPASPPSACLPLVVGSPGRKGRPSEKFWTWRRELWRADEFGLDSDDGAPTHHSD